MSIERIKAESSEMKGVLKFVGNMTKSMIFDENMEKVNWPKSRRRNDLFYRLMPRQKGIIFKTLAKIGNKGVLLAEAEKVDENGVIIYYHGGGFLTGNAFVCKSYASMLAKYTGYRVYAVDYSLAPEHPFPEGYNDCVAATEEIMKMHPDAKIVFVGESAGGNLSLGMGLRYKETGRIAAVIVHSPTVDFSGIIDRTINENKDIIVKHGCSKPLVRMYVKDNDTKDPRVSPYYGDYSGFPPLFISCDINETLYADSKALYEKCVNAGVDVNMIEFENTYHAAGVTGTTAPETKEVLKKNVKFIKKNCEAATR